MRPIFCGNFEFDARPSELERLFRKYGRVDRVDMKSGFAFIYMEDERDAEYAIRGLDRVEFGRKGRRLRVEWTKNERGVRKSRGSRRSAANLRPSKTLFVINFDPYSTKTRDLEKHFEPYGKIVNVRIRRNFAFVQYESEDDAIRALDATNMSKLLDRVISVEFSERDDDEKRNGYSPDQGHDRRRSRSPYHKERGSPDYGRGSSAYRRERGSPDYGRDRSPYPGRDRSPYPGRDRSPIPRRRERGSPDYGRDRIRSPHHKGRGERGSPYYSRRTSSPHRPERSSSDHGHGRSRSPHPREVARPVLGNNHSPSPRRNDKGSPQIDKAAVQSPYDGEKSSPENGEVVMEDSPYAKENASPDNGREETSLAEARDSPNYGDPESPVDERYNSCSPPAEE